MMRIITNFFFVILASICLGSLEENEAAAIRDTLGSLNSWRSSSSTSSLSTSSSSSVSSSSRSLFNHNEGSTQKVHEVAASFAGESRANKVSKLMHYVHGKARKSLLSAKEPNQVAKNSVANMALEGKTDEEILTHICDANSSTWCKAVLQATLQLDEQNQKKIVDVLKKLPPDVEAERVLYVALLGLTIKEIHSAQIDQGLNIAWDLVVKRNPYMYGATRAIDAAIYLKNYKSCLSCWFMRRKKDCANKDCPRLLSRL